MIRIKILLCVLFFISHAFCEDENSVYHYIDNIDNIKDLEEISNKYLILGDTLNAINTLIEITYIAELSEIYSDDFISDHFYQIGNLFLLINENENAEKYFLLSVDRYNKTKIRNQLLMHEPLLGLEKLYQKDSLKLKAISKQINGIKELEDFNMPDSLKQDMISFNSFNQNINIESEYFIYDQTDVASSAFYNGLYAQAVENLMNSLIFQVENISLDYYYNLDLLDSINFEYLYPALELQSSEIDTLNNYRGYFFMAMINSKSDNPTKAIQQINQYNIYNQNDSKAYELLGDIYFSINNWSDAFFQYYRTLLNNQEDLKLKFKMARCFIEDEHYQNALIILNQIINTDIYYEEAYYELGKLYLLLENYNLANENLTQSLLLNPNNKDAYYYLGLSYLNTNKYNFAMDSFNKVILLDELYANAHYYLGLIFESILDYEKAIIHYKKAKRYGSTFKELNIKYGGLLYNLNYFQDAINPLKDYLLENGDQLDVLIILGDIFYTEMRHQEAISIYNKLTNDSPENIFYKNRLANSFYHLQSYEEAINIYKEILIDNSENISIMKKLGDIYYELENYEESINYYNDVIECEGEDKDILYKIALSYIQVNKFLQSLITFKKASIYDPNNQIIQYQIGVTYVELELYNQALHYFINYNINDPDSKFMAGLCYYKLNNYNDAITAFDLYLELKKDTNIEVDYYKGLCYYFLKNFKSAAKHLKIVTKNDSENVDALYYLGRSYLELNKKREAKKIANNLYYLNIDLHDSLNQLMK